MKFEYISVNSDTSELLGEGDKFFIKLLLTKYEGGSKCVLK